VKRFYLNPNYFFKFQKLMRTFNPNWNWLLNPALMWAFTQAGERMIKMCLKNNMMEDYFHKYESNIDPADFHGN